MTDKKKHPGKLDYKGIGVLLAISIFLGFFYSFISGLDITFSIIAMIVAVFGSFIMFSSFFEEEKPVKLQEGEKMIIRTLDRGYILFPGKIGGFMSKKSQRDLNIYLTNRRILGRKSSGEYVFDQPLGTIEQVMQERRIMSKYLRLRYLDKGAEKDALLFVGDTDLWIKRLNQLGISEEDEFEEKSGGTGIADKFIEDAASLKKKIEKK